MSQRGVETNSKINHPKVHVVLLDMLSCNHFNIVVVLVVEVIVIVVVFII